MRLLLLLFLTILPAFSQRFSVGVKGGVPLNDFMNGARNQNFSFLTTTNRYVIGGQAELRLIAGFGVEFDALYRHYSFNTNQTVTGGAFTTTASTTTGAWEFPLLLKYRFPTPVVRPFVDAGVAWDRLSGLKQSISSRFSNPDTPIKKDTTTGFVVGAGLDIHVLLVHIQPEIRYTRWGSQHFSGLNNLLNSNQNQGEFLLGISF
jgi:opacity protein-like surface antigen